MLRQATHALAVATDGKGLVPITAPIAAWVASQGFETGLLSVFCRHTSASLLIQENADPTVRADLEAFFRWLVPEGVGYRHDTEGPDDMPAHIRSALTATQLSIPVAAGRMALGTWQGVYLWEHRSRRRTGATWRCTCWASDGAPSAACGQPASTRATSTRRAGNTSVTNQGLRRSHTPVRQDGCGSGKARGRWSRQARTRSVMVPPRPSASTCA